MLVIVVVVAAAVAAVVVVAVASGVVCYCRENGWCAGDHTGTRLARAIASRYCSEREDSRYDDAIRAFRMDHRSRFILGMRGWIDSFDSYAGAPTNYIVIYATLVHSWSHIMLFFNAKMIANLQDLYLFLSCLFFFHIFPFPFISIDRINYACWLVRKEIRALC